MGRRRVSGVPGRLGRDGSVQVSRAPHRRETRTLLTHRALRHVNNVHFLRYFESARLAFLSSLSPPLPSAFLNDVLSGQNIGFVVKSHNIKYKVSNAASRLELLVVKPVEAR